VEPRLGVKVLVKSFARIHETNLKKQGLLGLTFAKLIMIKFKRTILNFTDLVDFCPETTLTIEFMRMEVKILSYNHTYNEGQIGWFVAGSALNLIRWKSYNFKFNIKNALEK
jgi:aconitate hydratase